MAARAAAWLGTWTVAIAVATTASSGKPLPPVPVSPPENPQEIALGPGATRAGAPVESWARIGNSRVVRNVTRPTITPVLPAPGNATGTGVIVVPGGLFMLVAMDDEGWSVARWLADHGIAAFVVKYRTNASPADTATAFAELDAQVTRLSNDSPPRAQAPPPQAVEDARAAIGFVRSESRRFGIDPQRLGFLGFSAGAAIALQATLAATPEQRPAFLGYIYGPLQSITVPGTAPPLFAALASDDFLTAGHGFGLIESWQAAGRSTELHVYAHGGHGFGTGRPGTTSIGVLPQFADWLRAEALPGSATP
jgi:acetyl esterase/lipase